jgi:hypothetical protein
VSVAAPISDRRGHPLLVLTSALAAAVGVALGIVLAPGGSAESGSRAAAVEPRIGLASGVARLPLPARWRPLRRRSTLPGFEEATAVRAVHSEAAVDIRPPEHPSLLPAGAATAVASGLPEPRLRRLDDRLAWRYDLGELRPGTRVVAFALPTTGGVVTIACASPAPALDSAAAECEQAVRAVQLDGASALAPEPETAAAIVLPDTIAELNRHRRSERRRLAATRSPRRRSAAALRLARGYAAAAAQLRPLAAGDGLRLTETLRTLAGEHRALATASRRRDAVAARRAGAAIERDERRVAGLLAAMTERAR